MNTYIIPVLPLKQDLESIPVLKQLNKANKKLAELKGVAKRIPNENILINTLTLQEAKDSSAVENIITTQDDLYKADLNASEFNLSSATKEVIDYANALKKGFALVRKNKILSLRDIKEIQEILEHNKAGFRTVPGTTLKNQKGEVVYMPPQSKIEVEQHMSNLEKFINDDELSDLDPLIKLAIIHHQFESIHPFYDANGRTGRIVNVLYLVCKDLLDLPILYLSRYVIRNKADYYSLLQGVRDSGNWEGWIIFILKAVEQTATETIILVDEIIEMMQTYKNKIKPLMGTKYKHEFLNNLFNHPYTKIEFIVNDIGVNRATAASYLDLLSDNGILDKVKLGRSNYYINMPLFELLNGHSEKYVHDDNAIETIHT